jgi:hypothetical protein
MDKMRVPCNCTHTWNASDTVTDHGKSLLLAQIMMKAITAKLLQASFPAGVPSIALAS